MSHRIAKAFNRSQTTRAVALDIFKASNRVWHAGLLHKHKSHEISGQIIGLISSFLIIYGCGCCSVGSLHMNI